MVHLVGTPMQNEVIIRRYKASDIDAIYAAVDETRAELRRWMAWCHADYSCDDVARWVAERASAWDNNREWEFLISNKEGRILGACGIHRIDLMHQVGEIGYWVRSSESGHGIATEATRQLCRWAFTETPLRRLELLAAVENLASRRVAVKVGAVQEGVLRQRMFVNGEAQNSALYAILRSDYEKIEYGDILGDVL